MGYMSHLQKLLTRFSLEALFSLSLFTKVFKSLLKCSLGSTLLCLIPTGDFFQSSKTFLQNFFKGANQAALRGQGFPYWGEGRVPSPRPAENLLIPCPHLEKFPPLHQISAGAILELIIFLCTMLHHTVPRFRVTPLNQFHHSSRYYREEHLLPHSQY